MAFLGKLYNRIYRRVREEFFPSMHPFDQAHGVDTSGRLNLRRLVIHSPNRKYGRDYQGVEPGRFADALAEVPVRFPDFTFVDLGAGKGRALMMAHKLGFRRLIGVEFSPRLAETAVANILKLGLTNIEVLTQDAAEFPFPDEPLVVFVFNSFGPEVLKRVLENLRERTSPTYFVYVNPLHDSIVRADQCLVPVSNTRFHSVWSVRPAPRPSLAVAQLEVSA